MFTGIIERPARITATADHPGGKRITISHRWTDLAHGESISVNGCCLTVAEFDAGTATFDVIAETLDKSNLGGMSFGELVHVERALAANGRLDGHFVQGHVDTTAELIHVVANEAEWRLRVRVPEPFVKYLMPKGSVCIDGVSLTIADLDEDWFEVALIPTTLDRTALGQRAVGYMFNFEADILTKTIVTHLERTQPGRTDQRTDAKQVVS